MATPSRCNVPTFGPFSDDSINQRVRKVYKAGYGTVSVTDPEAAEQFVVLDVFNGVQYTFTFDDDVLGTNLGMVCTGDAEHAWQLDTYTDTEYPVVNGRLTCPHCGSACSTDTR